MGKGNQKTKPPHQTSLFGEDPKAHALARVAVTRPGGALNAAQRNFNRLTGRIRRQRERLAEWEAFIPRFRSRVAAELAPLEDKLRDVERRTALQLDALLSEPGSRRLGRKYRAKARGFLLELVDQLLRENPDPELEALYDRHSDVTRAEQKQEELEVAELVLGEIFGKDTVQGHEARSMEELLRHAGERMAEGAERREEEASARRARNHRPNRTAEREAEAAHEASLSVRDVYRKLVSALHPDRETDAAERERKTGLMQRANQAYERNSLLELLALQIEIEQIDADALAELPEARLKQYNQVLQRQWWLIERELDQYADEFRLRFDLPFREITPPVVDQALSASVAQAGSVLRRMEQDLEKLADPREQRAVLDAMEELGSDDFDPDDVEAFADAFAQVLEDRPPPAPPAARRQKRKRKQR